jgi:Zn-dependent protease/CBS domain-containing protein
MFWKRFHLMTLLGFPIQIDVSWFVIAALLTWSLATQLFPSLLPGMSIPTYWVMGGAGAFGLFGSVLLHELGHAVVARMFALQIRRIVLFIFGGVAEMADEPPHARAEFFVAIGGPLVSVALVGVFLAAQLAVRILDGAHAIVIVFGYLAAINGLVVAFNMIPAFPLDGGRVLRSILWAWKDDLRWATWITSRIGAGFGILLMAAGVLSLVTGDAFGGLWWGMIGLFLFNAARLSYQQVLLRRALEGEPLERFITYDPVTVTPSATLAELVESLIYRHHHKMYPVVEGERLLGCVTTREIAEIPREEWPFRRVGEIARPCAPDNTISRQADAMEALTRMNRARSSRLMVVEGERLVGIVALKDMLRFLSLKLELGREAA